MRNRFATYFQSGMPPLRAPTAEDARAEHAVEVAARDHRRHRGDEPRRVLVVRMDHHDDVRAALERLGVAGLLVPAVAAVLRVDDVVQPELVRDSTVPSRLASSTRMTSSTTLRSISATVCPSVASAL